MVIVKPMGAIGSPQDDYINGPFMKGFTEGYNTMDALASLVFGIIVIKAIRAMGVTNKHDILKATAKSGAVATAFLAIIYVGIAYLGATSTDFLVCMENGGPVSKWCIYALYGDIWFSHAWSYYYTCMSNNKYRLNNSLW